LVGEKKLAKVIVPDKWKEGASNTTEGGGRKINENKLLSKKNRFFFLNDLLIWSSMLKKENLITEELAKLNKVVTFVKLGKE
jgi:hypothetical protein